MKVINSATLPVLGVVKRNSDQARDLDWTNQLCDSKDGRLRHRVRDGLPTRTQSYSHAPSKMFSSNGVQPDDYPDKHPSVRWDENDVDVVSQPEPLRSVRMGMTNICD